MIIEAAKAVVKAENGRAAIAVVDFNGNLVSLDSMDGTSGFWVKFAIGKAMGAATLQQTTAESGDQLKTNPQRFHSALSLMEGQIILIPGGFPLIVETSSSARSVAPATVATAMSARSKPASRRGKNCAKEKSLKSMREMSQ